jgi:hypothetical protein
VRLVLSWGNHLQAIPYPVAERKSRIHSNNGPDPTGSNAAPGLTHSAAFTTGPALVVRMCGRLLLRLGRLILRRQLGSCCLCMAVLDLDVSGNMGLGETPRTFFGWWAALQAETSRRTSPLDLDVANALQRMWTVEEGGAPRTWQPGATNVIPGMDTMDSTLRELLIGVAQAGSWAVWMGVFTKGWNYL